jgi:hypothetical protein
MCHEVAATGHLELLHGAHEQGCPFNADAVYSNGYGQWHILQWMCEKEFP